MATCSIKRDSFICLVGGITRSPRVRNRLALRDFSDI
jgi:hypothetical protein